MSEKLPVLSGREIIKALAKAGFVPVRQKGSHVFLRHVDGRRTVVPLQDEVNKSTVMDIIEQTKLARPILSAQERKLLSERRDILEELLETKEILRDNS